MAGRFTVLASGSSGNAALLEMDGFGLLIDCGLQPRTLTSRLQAIGAHWHSINAVILTHTHGDHWKDLTLADLRSRRIPFYAHAAHLDQLAAASPSFDALHQARLTRPFAENRPLEVNPGLRVRPIRVSHDAEPTFAFRIDGLDGQGVQWSLGYASDLGCGSAELIQGFADVDVLALEYNHDIALERRSRRPRFLVDRVLSDLGHLSNGQAAELTRAIAAQSAEGFPSQVIQLHLSRECNRPELAEAAGRSSLLSVNPAAEVITARQDRAGKPVALELKPGRLRRSAARTIAPAPPLSRSRLQPSLPGFDD